MDKEWAQVNKQKNGLLRAARRGVGLALAGIALWGVAVTADLTAAERGLERLEDSRTAVALLAGQTRVPAGDGTEPEGPGRLLLGGSSLLAQGWAGVQRLRQARTAQEEPEDPPEDQDDIQQPALQPPVREDGVLEMTGRGKEGAQYLFQDGVYLYNRTKLELTPAVLSEGSVNFTLGDGPQILIYHTHGSEAHIQSDGETYTESDAYRTTDCTHNVVRVGEEIAQVLRSYGFQVIHDTELYDYPAYSGAYERSGAAVQRWLEQYPTIKLALDVHRDALVGNDGSIYKLITNENGQRAAQVMLVVGAGHEGWKDNLALAVRLQRELVADYVTLARPAVLRTGKYNQDRLPGSLLVEVGGHGKPLTEALAGARMFAQSAAQVYAGLKGS